MLQALEDHGWSWTAWDLHPAAAPCLISDWKYTPTPSFGRWVKQALLGAMHRESFPRSTDAPATDPTGRAPLGIFENHGDVGTVLHPGSATYDAARQSYTVAGSGDNMWSSRDAFHYVWKQAAGDLSLAADVSFVGAGREPHRKACLVIRQDLDADSAYVDVALHGDGLASLQFRDSKGAATHEVQANLAAPRRLRVVKRGKYVVLDLAGESKELGFSGAAVRITFQEPFYVGLGVCAHNKDVTETALFSERGAGIAAGRCTRLAGVVQHARDADDLVYGSPRGSCYGQQDRSSQLAARWKRPPLQ